MRSIIVLPTTRTTGWGMSTPALRRRRDGPQNGRASDARMLAVHAPPSRRRPATQPPCCAAARAEGPMGLIDRNPVLGSLLPVIEASRHVRTHPDAIAEVASWMAYEEFTLPGDMFLFPLGDDPGHVIDVLQLSN